MTQATIQFPLGNMDDGIIVCPVCGFEGNHLVRAEVEQLSNRVVIRNGETRVEQLQSSPNRGSSVLIRGYCENGGHVYDIRMKFHKGTIYTWAEHRPDQEREPTGGAIEELERN